MISRWARVLAGALAVVALGGCAGYKLGPTNGLAAGGRTIEVTPFSNKTLEPRLGDAVTSAVRRSLQNDGTYKLSSNGDGDIVVTGAIMRYQRFEISFLPNDVLTARDYRLMMTVHVTAKDRSSGKVILDKPVTGSTIIRVGNDLTSTERQALPLLADDLARNVTENLVDSTW